MGLLLSKLLRWLIYLSAGAVIVLALLVGIARLLLPLAPEYQNEIRRWAGEAAGLNIEFQRISASWPLSGPQLRFFNVSITSLDGRPVLSVDRLTTGVSVTRFLRDRDIALSRVEVSGARVMLQRDPDGTILLQGRPVSELVQMEPAPDREFEVPDMIVELDEIDVTYVDANRTGTVLDFAIDQLDLRLSEERISLDGEITLSENFGGPVAFSLDLPTAIWLEDEASSAAETRQWDLYIDGAEFNIARILRFGLAMETPLKRAHGDLVVWGKFDGMQPASITVELDANDVEFTDSAGTTELYQFVSGRLEWDKRTDGWLLAGNDIYMVREDRAWPTSEFSLSYETTGDGGGGSFAATASFLRLHDLYPMVRAVASEDVRTSLLPLDIRGDLKDLDLEFNFGPDAPANFNVNVQLDDLSYAQAPDQNAIFGLTGSIVADQDGGRAQINSTGSTLVMPGLFSAPLEMDIVEGFLVWRVTRNQIRVLSDNVRISTPFVNGRSRFELSIPSDGGTPYLDLTAVADASDAPEVLQYLPMRKFSERLQTWLQKGIVAGRITAAEFEIRGPLADFPFDRGEGLFRIAIDVENGILDYADRWPRVEDISARLVFDGLGMYSTRNRGRIGDLPFEDQDIQVANLRNAMIEVSGQQAIQFEQGLAFLRSTPIADALGPTLNRVTGSGTLDSTMQLVVPIKNLADYKLQLALVARDCTAALEGVDFDFSKINGTVSVQNMKLFASGLTAELLEEPVRVDIRPARSGDETYSHFVIVNGSTPVDNWTEVLKLPGSEYLSGRIDWDATASIPQRREDATAPFHIAINSDLIGVQSMLPMPMDKEANAVEQLQVDVVFPRERVLEVFGRTQRDITWALRLVSPDDTWLVERGAVHAGPDSALLPLSEGIELSGALEELRFDEWLALESAGRAERLTELYREIVLDVDQLFIFGQAFPNVIVEAVRSDNEWHIQLDSPNAVGQVTTPIDLEGDQPIVLDMERLWLLQADPAEGEPNDPRNVVPVKLDVDDFAIGGFQFGSLTAEIGKVADGVMIKPLNTQAESFSISGDAEWLVDSGDAAMQHSRLRFDLKSDDVAATLTSLDYEPVIQGESAQANADLTWPGPPGRNFLDHADGELNIKIEKGALLELEPGGGRLLGVLSVAALPRRLALDFSDVFDEGLSFKVLQGDFSLDDGDAYTCNLGLEASVADLAVVGRAGIAVQDYDQLAVVKPHVSNVGALAGAVVGGPAVGAAVLLLSQIFRKPLSSLGESYYRIYGSWEDPEIERVQASEVDITPFRNCERYLAEVLPESADSVSAD